VIVNAPPDLCAVMEAAEKQHRQIRELLEREGHFPSAVVCIALLRIAAEITVVFPDLKFTKPIFLGLADMSYEIERATWAGCDSLDLVVTTPKDVS